MLGGVCVYHENFWRLLLINVNVFLVKLVEERAREGERDM